MGAPAFHAMPVADELARLRQQNARLQDTLDAVRAEVGWLREALGSGFRAPPCLGLSRPLQILLGALLSREIMSRDALFAVLYADRSDGGPGDTIIRTFLCRLRIRLRPHGITLRTRWGVGWYFDAADKARIRALCGV